MPTMTVPSATMRRLRREGLEIRRRRAAGLAPTGGVVAKKPSPPPLCVLALSAPLPRPRPAPTTTSPPAPRRAGGDRATLERARPTPPSASPRSRHAAVPAEVITSKCIGKGAQVRVRTRVATARTGQPIVFWLRAVVDSGADDDGCIHVTYSYIDGKLPRTARVAPRDIRMHDAPSADARSAAVSTDSSSEVTTDRSAPRSQQDEAAPRPTVAGKKLPLLKNFEKEMKTRSKAIKGCW